MTDKAKMPENENPESKIQGEGDYEAARRFRKAEEEFVAKGEVEKKAREAEEALDGPEGEDLERARRETGTGHPH